METMALTILGAVGVIIGSGVVAMIGWLLKKTTDKVDDHEIRINKLENQAVTPEQVRSIVNQSNEILNSAIIALRSDLSNNTSTMQSVLIQLARREGFEEGLKRTIKKEV